MALCFRTFSKVAVLASCGVLAVMPAATRAQQTEPGAVIATKGKLSGAACASCHGAKGEGNAAAGFPRLAGLPSPYLLSQLDHFANGSRENAVMTPIGKQLTAAERQSVADYYGSLPSARGVAVGNEETLKQRDKGAWLMVRGRWEDNLPACVQCHGPGGDGAGAAFPALAGQPAAYIASQLQAFKNGARPGGPLNLMAVIAKKLSDNDIDAVAQHIGAAQAAPSTTVQEKRTK